MATNNSVNSPLSGTTGTGNFVGSTSPTLTTPKIGQINDATQNLPVASFLSTPSSVNYLEFLANTTGENPRIDATGTDSNISINLVGKGAGAIQISSLSTSTIFSIYSGPAYQHLSQMNYPSTASVTTYTFPDLTGTVALSGASQNVSFNAVYANSIYDNTNSTGVISVQGLASGVNYWTISNNVTGQPVYMRSSGSDTNIGQYFITKGDAGVVLQTAGVGAPPLAIQSGTSSQHTTNFLFSNTAATRTVTFPDLTGTVALSGASQNVTFGQLAANGSNIASYAFTAHGATDQNLTIGPAIAVSSAVCIGAVNDANSVNIPLEIRASSLYCSAGMVNSTAGNIVKWNPTGGQFTYDTQPLAVSLGGTDVAAFPKVVASGIGSGQNLVNATLTKLLFPSEPVDTNNNFASSTFTPTVPGYYQVSATFTLANNIALGILEMNIDIYKNGGNVFSSYAQYTQSATYQYSSVTVTGLVYLNGSTDYLDIYGFQANNTASTVAITESVTYVTISRVV